MGKRIPIEIRFWRYVDKSAGCWTWTGSCDGHGYGHIKVNGKLLTASRVSWELHYGAIPTGLWVLHACDNPPCVRPSHLFLGTRTDNVHDMLSKGRRPPVSMPGERNPLARLSADDIPIIRARVTTGERRSIVAADYGVSASAVEHIVAGRRWAHIPFEDAS